MVLNVGPDGKLIIEAKETVEQSKEKKPLFNIFKKKEQPVINTESKDVLSKLIEENKRLKDMVDTEHNNTQTEATEPVLQEEQVDNGIVEESGLESAKMAQEANVCVEELKPVETDPNISRRPEYTEEEYAAAEEYEPESIELTQEPVIDEYVITLFSATRQYRFNVSIDELESELIELERCKLSYNPEDKIIKVNDTFIDIRKIESWNVKRVD